MKHGRLTNYFGRDSGHRKAMFRNLIGSLVEHERITTTLAKAKELRRHVEKAITMGKENTLSNRRMLLSRLPNKAVVEKIFTDLGPRFKTRAGGYTRILKIGLRPGDSAEMAIIEFVDYKNESAEATEKVSAKEAKAPKATAKKATAKKAAPTKKATAKKAAAKAKAKKKVAKKTKAKKK